MKILFNLTCYDSIKATGIERFAFNIAREICKIEPTATVVSSGEIAEISNAIISRVLAFSKSVLNRYEYIVRAIWDQTLFRSIIANHKPDILFFPIQEGMLYPPVKQIVTVHDLHYLHFNGSVAGCKEEIPAHRRLLYRLRMPHILNRSAAVIAVSESTKRDLVETFDISPDKVYVVYNGYNSDRFHEAVDPLPVLERLGIAGRKYLLFVGSILRHKNIMRLLQAFASLDRGMMLVIAGVCKDREYLAEVMKTAVAGLYKDRVVYLAYLNDDDLPALYSGATAFILPSLHEGFGVPIIEAMACGTPVITSNCSAMPEVAGNAALLIDPYSVESIAAAMRKIIDTPEYADSLRCAGLERAKMFRWSYSAQKLYDVCKMVSGM